MSCRRRHVYLRKTIMPTENFLTSKKINFIPGFERHIEIFWEGPKLFSVLLELLKKQRKEYFRKTMYMSAIT
jgi:hypothetical protein